MQKNALQVPVADVLTLVNSAVVFLWQKEISNIMKLTNEVQFAALSIEEPLNILSIVLKKLELLTILVLLI